MCFNGDEDGPDIWLTVENGRYVPAPPMVYVPGLRQIQDRLQRNANHAWAPPTPSSDIVRLPIDLAKFDSFPRHHTHMSTSSGASCSATNSTEVAPEHSTRISSSSVPSGQSSTLPMPAPNNQPAETSRLSEAPALKSSKELSRALPEAQALRHQEGGIGTNGGSHGSGHGPISCSTSATQYSPSTSSSSLRSILKKPSPSLSECAAAAERVTKISGKDGVGGKAEEPVAPRPRIRKSVSFADMAASSPLRPESETAAQATAVEEGAAIAKKFVEMGFASRGRGKASKGFGSGRESADVRYGNHNLKKVTKPGRGMGEYGYYCESPGDTTSAPCRWCEGKGRTGTGWGRRTSQSHHLRSTGGNGSNIDDEIPGKLPLSGDM